VSAEVDFLVHLPRGSGPESEVAVDPATLAARIQELEAAVVSDGLRAAHLSLIDPELLKSDEALAVLRDTEARGTLRVSCGIRAADGAALLPRAQEAGLWGLKIHTYLHEVGPADRRAAVDLGVAAAAEGLVPVVCGAYGTAHLGERFGLPVAAELVRELDGPVVLAHAGGLHVMEAFLVADERPNLVLDFSFSPMYWKGSRLDRDFAWVLGRLGPGQAVLGSDRPYQPWAESRAHFLALLEEGGAASRAPEILAETPARLLGL
jgi:predicted TIM-barrel fold metal-dependent hydrolase